MSNDVCPTDLELLRRVRKGDEAAFHELVDRHAGELFGVAYSLVGNAADAEDVVQETLTGAFQAAAAFREQASVRTWLMRILVRQAARVHRSAWRNRTISIHQPDGEDEPQGRVFSSPSLATQVESKVDVQAMLRTLSPEHRQVIVLRELNGLSYEEMAQVLGVPQGTVESRLFRARQELKERFKGYLQDTP